MERENQASVVLTVKDLEVSFVTDKGTVNAINDVSFQLEQGEVLGIVGESGCGKSVTISTILGLLDKSKSIVNGTVSFHNKNLLGFKDKELVKIRGNYISMIHQNPMTSLDPLYKIGNQIKETILKHQKNVNWQQASQKAIKLLNLVGIPRPEVTVDMYPHQLSGGMKQRVMIAIALACEPEVLIADEPTTALDVTIQAQILDLLDDLKKKLNMSIIFITHDLGVVAEFCTKIVVMYLGQVVESADVHTIFKHPKHPYTQGLLKSVPKLREGRRERLYSIEGSVPSLNEVPSGCRFSTRCPFATIKCVKEAPKLEEKEAHHLVRCWLAK